MGKETLRSPLNGKRAKDLETLGTLSAPEMAGCKVFVHEADPEDLACFILKSYNCHPRIEFCSFSNVRGSWLFPPLPGILTHCSRPDPGAFVSWNSHR